MPESSPTLVQTADEEATTLTPSEQTFLQSFAQEVMRYEFVEAVLYNKRGGQLYVRTVLHEEGLEARRAVVHSWTDAVRNYDMLRSPLPDYRSACPPPDVKDLLARGFHIVAQK